MTRIARIAVLTALSKSGHFWASGRLPGRLLRHLPGFQVFYAAQEAQNDQESSLTPLWEAQEARLVTGVVVVRRCLGPGVIARTVSRAGDLREAQNRAREAQNRVLFVDFRAIRPARLHPAQAPTGT